jgi:hypothetical protein
MRASTMSSAASEKRSYVRVLWTTWVIVLVRENVTLSVPKKFASIVDADPPRLFAPDV